MTPGAHAPRAAVGPRAALGVTFLLAAAGCRRPARVAPPAVALPALEEDHCWWAAFRTPLPPRAVAARFAGAFTALGLAGVAVARDADTAWAVARPTALGGGPDAPVRPGTYAARVVAFRRGDSTLYRHFVAAGPPPGPASGPDAGGRHIAFCGALLRAAAVGGTAPRAPDGEERRPVWARGRPGGVR